MPDITSTLFRKNVDSMTEWLQGIHPDLRMPSAYYNENDKFAAQWLRNLVAKGLIADGKVDERSIVEVEATDLEGFDHHHFFAGIGGWSLALQLAGWPAGKPVWTGSVPCQPLSGSGHRKGASDPRHLWPAFYALLAKYRPATVFGEQVASKLGREWLCAVRLDLEGLGYAVGAADLPASSVGAPHVRQRLWWVAERMGNSGGDGLERRLASQDNQSQKRKCNAAISQPVATSDNRDGCVTERMENASLFRRDRRRQTLREDQKGMAYQLAGSSKWNRFDTVQCQDGATRPIEPGSFPVAHGIPARVGRLRGYGNAIVPQVAAVFIVSYMETLLGA